MGDPLTLISKWFEGLLAGWGLSPALVVFIKFALGVFITAAGTLGLAIFLVWVERKVVARFQDRLGPNRLGPYGLFQPFADILKLLIKEDITPEGADRVVYNLAPMITMTVVLMLWAVIPVSATLFGTDLNVGVLYIVALGALGTLSLIMAGWASNNKYALLGAFRNVAQIISYEVPMIIALLIPVILAESMGLNTIVQKQSIWFVVYSPLAALILFITAIAELGRAPFDLNEAESEIVAGFHIEYTGMKFGLFYASELLHALTFGGIIASLFLGGWRGPGAETYPILGIFYFFIKAFFLYWAIMWIKYSLPRLRIDQMMDFNWKFLTPLAIVVLMVTAILAKILPQGQPLVFALGMLAANLVVAWVTLQILRSRTHLERERARVAEPSPIATPERGRQAARASVPNPETPPPVASS